jgi:hypothetical protein
MAQPNSPILMADSTRPWTIPNPPVKHVLVYKNGAYIWPLDQIARFDGHINIGVFGGDPNQAQYCRELDVERYDATPADAAPFLKRRKALGHSDGTIYCNRSTIAAVYAACKSAGVTKFRWHIATLDGTRTASVPSGTELWAVQFETVNGEYDLSVVYGEQDWS